MKPQKSGKPFLLTLSSLLSTPETDYCLHRPFTPNPTLSPQGSEMDWELEPSQAKGPSKVRGHGL
jgi:hypothetical protein